jgi:hypothetical protein
MALAGLVVDESAVVAYLHGLMAATLLGGHEFEVTVTVLGLYQITNDATY